MKTTKMKKMEDINKMPSIGSDQEKTKDDNAVDVDALLVKELGQLGLYQVRTILSLSIVVVLIAWSAQEYIFTAARIATRCRIPECENDDDGLVFAPDWILNAVPATSSSFDNCQRFANVSTSIEESGDVCPAELFDQRTVVACDEYVYENTNTIVYDFDIACDEWRRTLIGSVRTIGVLCAMLVVGFVSDRWGRRTALVLTSFNTAWIGLFRYFSNTYIGFAVSQFAESALGGGGYSCSYILVLETIGPKYRVMASAMLSSCYSVGQALTALVAWRVPNWRMLTLALYVPQLISITYFWILPESARWYISKGRYEEAETALKNIARVNKKQLSERSLIALQKNAEEEKKKQALAQKEEDNEPWIVLLVFQHKPILLRVLVSPVWWITLTFIYYGLTINSVNISGNPYVNFVAVSLIEIPGFWTSFILMDTIGRKPTLISAFWVCAACQLAYLFMPNDMFGASLAVYLLGKFSIAMVATAVYVYTAELFPTKYRHRLLGFSSMIGRIGAIVAPLTPAFGDQLPFILFAALALLAGLLVLLTSETRGARFPDTLQDAVTPRTREQDP